MGSVGDDTFTLGHVSWLVCAGTSKHTGEIGTGPAPWKERIGEVVDEVGGKENLEASELKQEILADAKVAYEKREEELGEEGLHQLQRRVLLSVMDRRWREHLYEMDYLKEGIGLRAMAQRDPLVEYQKEGGEMFNAMNEAVQEETVRQLFAMRKQFVQQAEDAAAGSAPAEGGSTVI